MSEHAGAPDPRPALHPRERAFALVAGAAGLALVAGGLMTGFAGFGALPLDDRAPVQALTLLAIALVLVAAGLAASVLLLRAGRLGSPVAVTGAAVGIAIPVWSAITIGLALMAYLVPGRTDFFDIELIPGVIVFGGVLVALLVGPVLWWWVAQALGAGRMLRRATAPLA
jgi:zinc transporter ZupT